MQDFFQQARIKKLRKIAGGDTYVVIYLKLMLLTINNNGVIEFENIEDSIESELALILDEEEDNVKVVLSFLMANNLCEQLTPNQYQLVEVKKFIGSETASTQRSRKSRSKQKALQCNTTATLCNTEKEVEKEIYIDDDEKKRIMEQVKLLAQNELEFDALIDDFISFITLKDNSKISNRFTYSTVLKSKLISGDNRTLLNFDTFYKNQEILAFKGATHA